MKSPGVPLDKHLYRQAFDRAASRYDEVAVLQKEVGQRLLERLNYVRMQPECILDLGSGTGLCTMALAQRYKKAQIIALDIAPAMLQHARNKQSWLEKTFASRQRFLCGDADFLPLKDQSVDMIISNLTLQWCPDLDHTFAELRRVLKPDGLLMFTTLGPDTLKELRRSWQSVDANIHVHAFIDMHDVGDALIRTRFADPVMDMETITMTYKDARTLMQDLKTLGAHNASPDRPKGLTGKNRLQAMLTAYEQFRSDNVLPATYEVVYGQAWTTPAKYTAQHTDQELHVPFHPRAK
ncbi:MAG: malonyl-[acyl-carrier protein] O-methyltransferase BioC [Gammaproteobacteria bacterium SG8_11]|nr:MAG: malonyl-[acyl-carrier protein] O-methyltransferase BioC [Gammaproteobacteria bacterium SG8_11]